MKFTECYLDKFIENDDGISFQVIDVDKIEFDDDIGRKKTITKVVKAEGGEKIITYSKQGEIESIMTAEKDDCIFVNSETDKYIPGDENGHWKFNTLTDRGYEIVENKGNEVYVKSTNYAHLLVDIIKKPTCILNAFGEGAHQFLYNGATIKKDIKTGKVSGISNEAFHSTWEVKENISEVENEII